MRKITFILFVFLSTNLFFGKTVYVNGLTGSDLNDGSSWATALKTLSAANSSSKTTTGDNIWVAGGATYTITSATSSTTATSTSFYQGDKNWYGGFNGTETTLTQRILSDIDGNGNVDPWEFQNASTINLNLTDATGIIFGAGEFNGFTLSATATYNSRFNYVYALNASTIFSNNILKNNTVTLNMISGGTYDTYYPFFRSRGNATNNLFEKNTVTVNALSYYCYPFINVENSTATTIGTKFINNVIRNNKVKVDYTGSSATTNSVIRGLILNVIPAVNTSGLPTTVANCVINNNEMQYVPSASNVSGATLTNGATISISTQNSSACTDSVINCTLANNKGIKIKCGGIYIGSDAASYHYVLNNVFYNNRNTTDGSTYNIDNMSGTVSSNIGVISNNFTNGGGLTNTTGKIFNQDNTLDVNSPLFINPTLTYGQTTDNSSELSNWSIGAGSYLIAKGTSVSGRTLDKAGYPFATTRAVGAYELRYYDLTISYNSNGSVTGYTNGQVINTAIGTTFNLELVPNSGYFVNSLLYNGVENKSNIISGHFTTTPILSNTTVVVTFDLSTILKESKVGYNICQQGNNLTLSGIEEATSVRLFDANGKQVFNKVCEESLSLTLKRGIYILIVNNNTKKIAVL